MTATITFQMQNEVGLVFTVNAPLGNKPGSRMDAANNIMRDLAAEGLMPVKPNAVVRKNMNGGQQRKAAPPRPSQEQRHGQAVHNPQRQDATARR
jgi:hypothetical protein